MKIEFITIPQVNYDSRVCTAELPHYPMNIAQLACQASSLDFTITDVITVQILGDSWIIEDALQQWQIHIHFSLPMQFL